MTREIGTGTSRTYRTNRNENTNSAYVYGNTARKLAVQRQFEEPRRKSVSHQTRKNREKAQHMSLGYIVFLMAAFSISAMVLISYIRLNAEIITLHECISAQEKELNDLRIENAEALTRIESSIDLEEIKRVAIQELGMTYPIEGQIVAYEGVTCDYVRRVADGN